VLTDRADLYILQAKRNHTFRESIRQAIIVLSLLVILAVFWGLKLTGITLAGEAFCGKPEHSHSDVCLKKGCVITPHTHIVSCYSNLNMDLETSSDWQNMMDALPKHHVTADNVVTVAQSQLGYQESKLNFQVDTIGLRRGISRYGQWYGNPYGDWSAMFVSFCLHYAGVTDLPANAGAESMRTEWMNAGLYKPESEYAPHDGDVLFLTKDGIRASAVAIITGFAGDTVTAIQGDVDGAVSEKTYDVSGGMVLGYGLVPDRSGITVLATPSGASAVAITTPYRAGVFNSSDSFVLYTESGGQYYALDGSGNAVQVYIDDNGMILSDTASPNNLLWTFTQSGSAYVIRNVGTGRHLHPYYNNYYDYGITTSGGWTTSAVASGNGVKFRASAYAKLNSTGTAFEMTRNEGEGSVFQIGVSRQRYVWLDGTNGGIMSLGGSPNQSYTAMEGSVIKLPTSWTSPDKYDYRLRGWYDVTNNQYYAPGAEVTVNGNMVFYADWMASTYDVGQFNSMVSDTVSTNNFVTARMFDYGFLFNLLSSYADVTVDGSGHTEVWNLLTSGNNLYNGEQTLNYIFRDWDRGNEDISYPKGHNDRNNPTSAGNVYPGLYNEYLAQLLFDPQMQVIGKQYVGEGDHLFHLCLDPNDPYYGYYYYNSELNAASYNQTDQRFYVYDYLECTRDSSNSTEGKYADFLPLNSPYANTNGKTVHNYNYAGINGEYNGTTHYMYDSKYNTNGNSANNVGTNYLFGMSLDIDFYLPHQPGTVLDNGGYGNQDLYGGDMHFKFTGDDDVWVLVDDKLVLDLGGIHGIEGGDINFSTGVVTINGVRNEALSNTLKSILPGEHKLTLYYLERGSSLSNCAIYFNLAPRFHFSIQKEDVLTRDLLNGAQFSVFMDKACTIPAQLWTSSQAYYDGQSARNVFTVANGSADMWGLISGETYYIKETKGPDALGYGCANGIICLTIDKDGIATYHVEVQEDQNGELSVGFTVHGIKIDEETQKAFIVATNAPQSIKEATIVQVHKVWNDSKDHSGDYITVYLTVTDPDGTVRRIREVVLSAENDWSYIWENLPKTDAAGNPVIYGVSESTVPGYVSKVEVVDPLVQSNIAVNAGTVNAAGSFENGRTYLLNTRFGYLSAENNQLSLVTDLSTAQTSDSCLWVATVNSDGTVRLTNKAGQTLYYDNYTFKAGSSPGVYQNLHFADDRLYCFIDHGGWSETQYPVDDESVPNNLKYNHVLYTTNDVAKALQITLVSVGGTTPDPDPTPDPTPDPDPPQTGGNYFRITNTPAGEAVTSLTVQKIWNTSGMGDASLYEMLTVQIRLLANGVDAGLTGEMSLRNGWQYVFENLPLYDSLGNRVQYSVQEEFISSDWSVSYGPVVSSGGGHPTYTVDVTNTYRTGGPELPSTGTAARFVYVLCGTGIVLGSLVFGFTSRRKRERRMK